MLLKCVSDLPTFITVYKQFIGYYKLQKCLCTNRANKIIIFVMCHMYIKWLCVDASRTRVCFQLEKEHDGYLTECFQCVHSWQSWQTQITTTRCVCVYDVRSQTQVRTYTYTHIHEKYRIHFLSITCHFIRYTKHDSILVIRSYPKQQD